VLPVEWPPVAWVCVEYGLAGSWRLQQTQHMVAGGMRGVLEGGGLCTGWQAARGSPGASVNWPCEVHGSGKGQAGGVVLHLPCRRFCFLGQLCEPRV